MNNTSRLISIVFILSDEDAERLRKPINGQGGFQSFLIHLQNKFSSHHNMIMLTSDDIKKIMRYANMNKGIGGFQGRLKGIIDSLKDVDILK